MARILVCALSAPCPAEETPLKSYENVVVVRGAAAAASCFPMALSPELGLRLSRQVRLFGTSAPPLGICFYQVSCLTHPTIHRVSAASRSVVSYGLECEAFQPRRRFASMTWGQLWEKRALFDNGLASPSRKSIQRVSLCAVPASVASYQVQVAHSFEVPGHALGVPTLGFVGALAKSSQWREAGASNCFGGIPACRSCRRLTAVSKATAEAGHRAKRARLLALWPFIARLDHR